MEQIYTVRVRSAPDSTRLYPSERAYSASTVGGLALVHLSLAALSFFFGVLGFVPGKWTGEYSGGLWLGGAATITGLTGVLAWRRWYVDHNIRWFFLASAFSAVASAVCVIITTVVLATLSRETYALHNDTYVYRSTAEETGQEVFEIAANNITVYNEPVTDGEYHTLPSIPTELTSDVFTRPKEEINPNTEIVGLQNGSKIVPFAMNQSSELLVTDDAVRNQFLVLVHVLVASFLELVWSVLSINIAWKGLSNVCPGFLSGKRGNLATASVDQQNDRQKPSQAGTEPVTTDPTGETTKSPDILENHKVKSARKIIRLNGDNNMSSKYNNVVKELCNLQKTSTLGYSNKTEVNRRVVSALGFANTDSDRSSLPMPESTMEYRERVERFLASNQHCQNAPNDIVHCGTVQ